MCETHSTMAKSQSVAILGGNGVYARHLVPRLIVRGHRVRALVRRPEAAAIARACGAEVAVADFFDERSLRSGLEGCDVAINLATSLPGPSGRGDYEANDRLRRDGTPIWAEACRRAGATSSLSSRAPSAVTIRRPGSARISFVPRSQRARARRSTGLPATRIFERGSFAERRARTGGRARCR